MKKYILIKSFDDIEINITNKQKELNMFKKFFNETTKEAIKEDVLKTNTTSDSKNSLEDIFDLWLEEESIDESTYELLNIALENHLEMRFIEIEDLCFNSIVLYFVIDEKKESGITK